LSEKAKDTVMSEEKKKAQEQKEISRIKLSDSSELVATIVDNEKLDLRVFVNADSYQGPTKRGVRFYLFDGIWEEFKKLVEKVNREYEKLS